MISASLLAVRATGLFVSAVAYKGYKDEPALATVLIILGTGMVMLS